MKRIALFLPILGALFATKLVAQPLEKNKIGNEFSVKPLVDFHLENGSRFLGGFSLKHSEFASTLVDEVFLGYEQNFKGRWSAGFIQRVYRNTAYDIHASQIFLRHGGHIGNLFFDKRLSYENRYGENNTEGNPINLFTSLGKQFQIKEHDFFAALSYELSQNTALEISGDQRRIDKTRLRADVIWVFKNKYQIGFFGRRETRYFFAQEQFDQNMMLLKPFRKLNLFTVQYGISFRLVFHQKSRPETIFNFIE